MNHSYANQSAQEVNIVTEDTRRSANYKPNIWKYDFLQSLDSKYDVRFLYYFLHTFISFLFIYLFDLFQNNSELHGQ